MNDFSLLDTIAGLDGSELSVFLLGNARYGVVLTTPLRSRLGRITTGGTGTTLEAAILRAIASESETLDGWDMVK